jgi:hypothetical protein
MKMKAVTITGILTITMIITITVIMTKMRARIVVTLNHLGE